MPPRPSALHFKKADRLLDDSTSLSHCQEMKKTGFDAPHMWTYFVHMRIVTLRDLRNHFSKLEKWLAEGEEIQIEKRGEPIALLTGLKKGVKKGCVRPDFAARRKAIWGKRTFSDAEVRSMRLDELTGEEG
jgi:antitoxin (DNA-binding transcriptional repressor) of toxin-antitoxin stability system